MDTYSDIIKDVILNKTPFVIAKKESLVNKTPFIIVKKELFELYEDINSEEPFAIVSSIGEKVIVTIIDFIDWYSIRLLLKIGHDLLNRNCFKTINIQIDCEMDDEFIYQYKLNERPWYSFFGYIPFIKTWTYSKLKDYYQLPFVKPEVFLELEHGIDFICPKTLILEPHEPLYLIAQKNPSDYHLRLLPSTSFYPNSKRPRTSMNHLRQKMFHLLDLFRLSSEIVKSGAPFKVGEDFFIPVVRYSYGMKNGCYFDKDEKHKFLGTFYYWEPDSGCYLKMGKKFGYFDSKFDCAKQMMYKLEQEHNREDKLFMKLEKIIYKIMDEISELFRNKSEEYVVFENNVKKSNDERSLDILLQEDFTFIYQGKNPKYLPINLQYKSTLSGRFMENLFYAAEDELDQILSKTLIYFGYDVVILGRMAGMYRVVTEVLDVRARDESLNCLYWRVD